MKYLIAGYGFPAEYVISTLFSKGVSPSNIALLTHEEDARNVGLLSIASLRGVVICQSKAKSHEAFLFAQKFQPDLIISMHYRELIPVRILSLSKNGGINLHPSLLPDYKGANSIPWALVNGESEIGFTYHYMNQEFDKGNIIYQERFDVGDADTSFSLFNKSMLLALGKLDHVINLVLDGYPGILQEPGGRYYSRSLPYEGVMDLGWDEKRASCFIRAMYFPPFGGAEIEVQGRRVPINTVDEFLALKR